MTADDPWLDAKRRVGKAYDGLLDLVRSDAAHLGRNGTVVAVPLVDGLECRITIAPPSPTLGPLQHATRPLILN